MMGRQQRANARMVLLIARNRYDRETFRVDLAGANYRPLRDAESLGWCVFSGEHCTLTVDGIAELSDYEGPRAVVSYVCPVCCSTVGQECDAEGLPVRPSCPTCAADTDKAVRALRGRLDQPA